MKDTTLSSGIYHTTAIDDMRYHHFQVELPFGPGNYNDSSFHLPSKDMDIDNIGLPLQEGTLAPENVNPTIRADITGGYAVDSHLKGV